MSNVTLYIPGDSRLADNRDWTNRFEITSETSDRIYVVAQHKTKRHWGCSCPAYRTRRYFATDNTEWETGEAWIDPGIPFIVSEICGAVARDSNVTNVVRD